MRGHLALPKKVEQSVCFFLTKGAKIIIFNFNLIQKRICRRASMEKFKLKKNYFGTFCACSRKLNFFFFQSISSSLRSQSLYHFVWEALGFSLFVATRFLYVKLLGFFVFWKALVKDSTSAVSRLSIFSLNLFFIVFNDAIIPLKASGQLLQ